MLIDNEILNITDVAGNDITVERGQYGTGDVDHNNGATVTLLTDNGVYLANYFTEGESISGGTSNASATLGFTTTDSVINTKYLVSLTQGSGHIQSDFRCLNSELVGYINLIYLILVTTTIHLNSLQMMSEGPNADPSPGTEYTAGVSKVACRHIRSIYFN